MEFKKRGLFLLLLLLFSLGSSFYIFTTDETINNDELDVKVTVESSDEDVGWLLEMELNGGDEEIIPSTKTENGDISDTGTETEIDKEEANGKTVTDEETISETDIETDEEVIEESAENSWWERWLLLLINMLDDSENTEDTEEVETTTGSSSGGSSKVNITYTDKTTEELISMMNATVAESMVTISMATNPVFTDGVGDLLIVNDVQNKYPQIVEIYTAGGTLIYQSGVIAVGNKVETAALLIDLGIGNHNCIATFNAIDGDTGELIARVNAKIVVTVK